MQYAEALQTVAGWLEEPRRKGLVLQVAGQPGAGKTRLLADVQQRFPAAVTIDCRGRTADEVATAALDGLGLDVTAARGRDPLIDTLARHRGESIVLLANAQWAGPLFSSDEPFRVGVVLAGKLGVQSGGCVRVVAEADADRERVAVTRGNDVLLELEATPGEPVDRLLTAHPALRALAAAETRQVPLPVWALLAQALGISATVPELSALSDALPGELLESHTADDSRETLVGFRADGIKHLIRAAHPLAADRQRALTEELLGRLTDSAAPDPVHAYAAQTVALHAALSGTELPGLLASAPALAHSARYALLQALARQWKHGVPQGGVASDIHYLEAEGIAPSAQGEWVSWLHWATLNRGDTAGAEGLATAGIALPWRTAWSRRRPYAAFGPLPGEAGNVDYLESGTHGGATAVAGQRVLPAFHDGAYVIPDGDERVLERVWSAADGTELGTPAVIDLFFDDEGEVESVEGRGEFRVRAEEDPVDAADPHAPFRLPGSVLCHRRMHTGRWALGGRGGLFAVDDLRPASTPDDTGPARWKPPFVAPHTTSALWNIPAELAAPHGPSPAALAEAFGPSACCTLAADALPTGLDDTTRRYLSDIGLPALYGGLYFATLAAIDETGLSPADWPAEAAIPPNGNGPFFLIGTWVGSGAYLDGATGRVIQDGLSGGSAEPVIAGSLRQYVSLLWLCRATQLSAFPTAAEERDAQRSARKWAAHVDPIVDDSATWKAILSGSLESDLIAAGWELPGLKPA
ncbi:hypothetical protein HEP86_15245 [Streptomyces sp. RPA4-5]|uniref:SUKH-4 family immunity protein n=1 Tax=Streptomyces sp. RPA4-5 TaxID=2721245 RepID=UPI00143E8C82|nr:SUKH-4 family immunity protein [Streptomyces sp. RPA4-5]QIY55634.1 hypothetical protein HEP86_15245 [Streptomyces sp. RPA4-5]